MIAGGQEESGAIRPHPGPRPAGKGAPLPPVGDELGCVGRIAGAQADRDEEAPGQQ
jgi:hypothetical protein